MITYLLFLRPGPCEGPKTADMENIREFSVGTFLIKKYIFNGPITYGESNIFRHQKLTIKKHHSHKTEIVIKEMKKQLRICSI
jgi:hypothetical protein